MPRKNIALEVALVTFVLIAAFILQAILSQRKPPALPEFDHPHGIEEVTGSELSVAPVEESDDEPELTIPGHYEEHLSLLGVAPDWTKFDAYQKSIRREDFERLMSEVYSVGDYWRNWFIVFEDRVEIRSRAAAPEDIYTLYFSDAAEVPKKVTRFWRKKGEIAEVSDGLPLAGLNIAIDPGHIGGRFAEIEERRFVLNEMAPPVQEGNMTLTVAALLVDQLEALGATTTLVREKNAPVNPFAPKDYYAYARAKLEAYGSPVTEGSVMREANKLFYRNGEIRARSHMVNQEIQPDLVLCLHFNAAGQPDPDRPVLFEREHFHMILNGAYTQDEMANDDERFQILMKILQGVHREEAAMAAAMASSFSRATQLPAYQYEKHSRRAVNVDGNPYLWARNLLANRLYHCPVLFFEPYLMNGKDSYVRMQEGDYMGLRYVNQKLRPSIYREYVNAVTGGLVDYFTQENAEK